MRDESRRRFVAGATSLAATLGLAGPVRSAQAGLAPRARRGTRLHSIVLPPAGERHIALHSTHTGERIDLVYWREGRYLRGALRRLARMLRDHRTGDVHPIHPRLFDYLVALRAQVERDERFEVISGYRSPKTNRMLRAHSSGVAKHSLHMDGKAIDIRLPGVRLATLRDAAIGLRRGGVGFYPRSDFIHVDVGRPRTW